MAYYRFWSVISKDIGLPKDEGKLSLCMPVDYSGNYRRERDGFSSFHIRNHKWASQPNNPGDIIAKGL